MRKIFYLSTCDTCTKFMKQIPGLASFEQKDIKTNPLTSEDMDLMYRLTGNYEALFSKRARKYRAMNLHEQNLREEDIRELILSEYTFLKRPVVIVDEQIFIGNAGKNLDSIKSLIK